MLPPDIKNTLLNTIKTHMGELKYSIILFGSYATRTENKYSDIDIAIKAEKPIESYILSYIKEDLEESNLLQEVDIVDYQRTTDDFKKIIDETGIILILL